MKDELERVTGFVGEALRGEGERRARFAFQQVFGKEGARGTNGACFKDARVQSIQALWIYWKARNYQGLARRCGGFALRRGKSMELVNYTRKVTDTYDSS